MESPSAQKQGEMREGEAEMMEMTRKKAEMMMMKKAKKSKGKKKKDTEIEKGPVASEGVTKMNDPRKKGMPSLDAGDFKADGCKCQVRKSRSQMKAEEFAKTTKSKRAGMPEKPPTGDDVPPTMKKDGEMGMKKDGSWKKKDGKWMKNDGSWMKKDGKWMKKDGGKKKNSVWAKGFEMNDAAFVLSEGADKLATEKYAREKRKRNAQSQPRNMVYANTFNT